MDHLKINAKETKIFNEYEKIIQNIPTWLKMTESDQKTQIVTFKPLTGSFRNLRKWSKNTQRVRKNYSEYSNLTQNDQEWPQLT